MIVSGIQMDIAWENPPENFKRAREWASKAMDHEGGPPELLVLPELFATGFSMDSEKVAAFGEETREFLAGLAAEFSVPVLGGYAENASPLPANACSIFSPTGKEVLHFQKLHPFSLAKEDEHYTPGESVATGAVGGIRVTPFICYDLRFPEPFRPAAPDTDLYCVIANWPEMRREAWSTLLRARAIENQAYVLGVNRAGKAGDLLHAGDSALVDPLGQVIATVEPYEEGLAIGEVDPEEVSRIRAELGFLKDRRPKLYGAVEEKFRR